MQWILVTVGAYFLGAVAVLLDKFLLGSKRISSPQVYTFFVGVFGLGALLFLPFGFSIPSGNQIALSLFSGALFVVGIGLLYDAISKAEASRVTPVVFSVVPLASYLFSLAVGSEMLSAMQALGVCFLVFGGLLISFDLPLKLGKKKFFLGFEVAFFSGIFLAAAYVLFKFVYLEQSFLSGFIWTRLGAFLATLFLLVVPKWRRAIFASFTQVKKSPKKSASTGGIFIGNKIIGGTSSIMLNYAISLGSVTLTNALVSLQYVFVLVLAAILVKRYPVIFSEKLEFWDWVQKAGAIIIIAIGMFLIS